MIVDDILEVIRLKHAKNGLKLTLPFPISVDSAYGQRAGHQRYYTKKAKEWLKACQPLQKLEINHKVFILYTLYFPDNRNRDGQNYLKLPLDYIVKQGLLKDDNRKIVCSEMWVDGGNDKENPRIEIEIFDNYIRK